MSVTKVDSIQKDRKVSIIIVCYNEENKIKNSIEVITAYVKKKKWSYEIIFVDDGSTDGTFSIVQVCAREIPNVKIITNKRNHGKGYVIRQGLLAAEGEYVVTTDADLAYPVEQLEGFLSACTSCDMVVGTRIHKNAVYIMNYKSFALLLIRHLTSRMFNLYVRLMFGISFTDTQCGIKVYKNRFAKIVAAKGKIHGFSYDVETFLIAKKVGARVKEHPVTVIHSYADSKVKIFRHTIKMFLEVLGIKWNEITGAYNK